MIKSHCFPPARLIGQLLVIFSSLIIPIQAQTSTQVINLTAGWNSVWLDVDPIDRDPAVIFNGAPIEQVWCYFPTEEPTEFIDDPTNDLWNNDAWGVFLPPSDPRSVVASNLAQIQPSRPYLIKSSAAAQVSIIGRPVCKSIQWRPNSFNLVGLPVEAGVGSSAGLYFFNDPALSSAKSKKFRLSTSGVWEELSGTDRINRGEAYWIFSDGESKFRGTFECEGSVFGELDFGTLETHRSITIVNPGQWPATVTMSLSPALPLLYESTSATGGIEWLPLSTRTLNIPAEGELRVRLAVQRTGLTGLTEGNLTLKGNGTEFILPVSIDVEASSLGAGGSAGLWVGNVVLKQVSDVNDPSGTPINTPSEISQKLLVHVDAGGNAHLLKQVIIMIEEGQFSDDIEVPATPGRHRLITDDALIPNFTGAVLRDGESAGIRLSAITYDFAGNQLPLSGAGFGSQLGGNIVIGKDLPTHPFRHRYHPDHNGLDDQLTPQADTLTPIREELWEIQRALEFDFDTPGSAPSDAGSAAAAAFRVEPDAGSRLRTGTYTETITGLHKNPIKIRGSFVLRRANNIDQLN